MVTSTEAERIRKHTRQAWEQELAPLPVMLAVRLAGIKSEIEVRELLSAELTRACDRAASRALRLAELGILKTLTNKGGTS